jgi:hypothetical protein
VKCKDFNSCVSRNYAENYLTEKIEEEFSVDTTPRSTFGFF